MSHIVSGDIIILPDQVINSAGKCYSYMNKIAENNPIYELKVKIMKFDMLMTGVLLLLMIDFAQIWYFKHKSVLCALYQEQLN